MSTRANIVIKDGSEKLFFYRHSDGYPEGTMPTLNIFMKWLKNQTIRNGISQGSGWLILLGALEYATIPNCVVTEKEADLSTIETPSDWKVGAYEPTTGIHGDIEYLYIIDLVQKTVECFEDWTEDGDGKSKPLDISKFIK